MGREDGRVLLVQVALMIGNPRPSRQARKAAKKDGVELVIHGKDGKDQGEGFAR